MDSESGQYFLSRPQAEGVSQTAGSLFTYKCSSIVVPATTTSQFLAANPRRIGIVFGTGTTTAPGPVVQPVPFNGPSAAGVGITAGAPWECLYSKHGILPQAGWQVQNNAAAMTSVSAIEILVL